MKKYFFFIVVGAFFVTQLLVAQEVPKELENIISPEIHADQTVTFRFFAPKADSVQLTADFLPPVKVMGRQIS